MLKQLFFAAGIVIAAWLGSAPARADDIVVTVDLDVGDVVFERIWSPPGSIGIPGQYYETIQIPMLPATPAIDPDDRLIIQVRFVDFGVQLSSGFDDGQVYLRLEQTTIGCVSSSPPGGTAELYEAVNVATNPLPASLELQLCASGTANNLIQTATLNAGVFTDPEEPLGFRGFELVVEAPDALPAGTMFPGGYARVRATASRETEPAAGTFLRITQCGDGVTDIGEACDDGADNSDTVPDACRSACVAAYCGDSVIDTGETCDDGGTDADDGCSATCESESDAGSPDSDAGMSDAGMADAGPVVPTDAGTDAGPVVPIDAATDAGEDPSTSAGCSCRATNRRSGAPFSVLLALAFAAIALRRRRD